MINRLLISLACLLAVPLFFTASASAAWKPFGATCQVTGSSSSSVCSDAQKQQQHANQNPLTGTNGLIMKVTNLIALIAGFVAVMMIVLAGLRFVQSGGSSDDVAAAKRMLIYSMVGIVVIVLGRVIIGFIIGSL